MRIEEDIKLDYNNVLIRPKRSTLGSRKEVDLERGFKFRNYKGDTLDDYRHYRGVPIMASNMDGVGTIEMADTLAQQGMFTCLVKTLAVSEQLEYFNKDEVTSPPDDDSRREYVAMSIGITDNDSAKFKEVYKQVDKGYLKYVCIDVANGYSEHFVDFVRQTRKSYPEKVKELMVVVEEARKELGDLNFKIALKQAEIESSNNEADLLKMAGLKTQTEILSKEIKIGVDELYSYQNSIDGVPISKVLPDWMNNVVETENLKAKIKVINGQKNAFQEVYAEYAPAGANMKRLEREISVSEQGYLEILHGLNLAKLKLQDSELSSSLKTIDTPYYPLSPNPTKRSILIIAAAFLGGLLTLGIIFAMEYFDDTLKNYI